MTLIQEVAIITHNEQKTRALLSFLYHEQLIDRIKPIPGRVWNPTNELDPKKKVWSIPIEHEELARTIIRPYLQIDGEESFVQWKMVKMIVTLEQDRRHSYRKGVLIDSQDIFNVYHGNLYTMASRFDILEQTGGFVSGGEKGAFTVRYEITIKIRKEATIEAVRGTYQIIEEGDTHETR